MRGGVRERTPGVWEVRFESGRDPATGRRRQVSRTVRGSEREALQALAVLVGDADAGRVFGAAASVGQLTDEWLAIASTQLVRPPSAATAGCSTDTSSRPSGADLSARWTRATSIGSIRPSRRKTVPAPSSVCQVHAVLSRAFGQAVRWGWIDSNPAVRATPPRRPRSPLDPPEPRQIAQLIQRAACTDPPFGRFLHVATATGARRGELCALRWRHLDTASAALVVEATIIELRGGVAERHAKAHATRRIALDSGTMAVFAAQRQHAVALARQAGAALTDHGYVFRAPPAASRHGPPTS